MLVSPRLDDQSYEEIVAEAEGRLPYLCPAWTDHNAHDPGITVLELMAWYKEMQQYQMDQLTPSLRRALLKLAGQSLIPASAARCGLEFPPEARPRRALERLVTEQGVPFELVEAAPEHRPRLSRVVVLDEQGQLDITAMVRDGLVFQPFRFGGRGESRLALGFQNLPRDTLRLWFQVERPAAGERSQPDSLTPPPRTLAWELSGAGPAEPLQDETWSLSWSGYVTLPTGKNWTAGEDGLYWLTLRQTCPGCEEQPRLSGISASRYLAAQQETRARRYSFQVEPGKAREVYLVTAQARDAHMAVFVRDRTGWVQTRQFLDEDTPEGRLLLVDCGDASEDGEDNLLVVCLDPARARQLLFTIRGVPGEELYLDVGGQQVLPEELELLCLTLQEDGSVRPALWRRVEELSSCHPRDRVFLFDSERNVIIFGDGEHGAIPVAGEGSALVCALSLSLCGGGNAPGGAGLRFRDGERVHNEPASGGRDQETLTEAQRRLAQQLSRTRKCVTAEDYAQRARETPGLLVAGARAIPGYDPRTPNLKRAATITVAVLPAGEDRCPVADQRFLDAVGRQLARRRTVCIRTLAVRVRYVPFSITVHLRMAARADAGEILDGLEKHFQPREALIGVTVRKHDIAEILQKLPGVLQVFKLELRGLDQNSYQNPAGDLEFPPDGIPKLIPGETSIES